jgi:hypothetical protein
MASVRSLAGGAALAWLALIWLAQAGGARAAPEEIQVYMDDMDKPGHFGLDLHNNYVFDGPRPDPAFPGALPSGRTYRFTPEFSYGITPNLEGGLYILSTIAPDGSVLIGGEKLRLKFIAPRPEAQAWYWGLNLEIGKVDHQYDQNPWNAELKGIWGYNGKRWIVAVNPNIDWTFSNRVHAPPTLEIDTKVAYRLAKDFAVGVESYDEAGELKALGGPGTAHNLYGTLDTSVRGWDLNLGLGWGLTRASDGLVAKAIVSVPFP